MNVSIKNLRASKYSALHPDTSGLVHATEPAKIQQIRKLKTKSYKINPQRENSTGYSDTPLRAKKKLGPVFHDTKKAQRKYSADFSDQLIFLSEFHYYQFNWIFYIHLSQNG